MPKINAPPEKAPAAVPHNLIVEDRQRFTATGVLRMINYDEGGAAMETGRGTLTVTGRGLSVDMLSLETGEVRFSGQIDAVAYTDNAPAAGGFWRRLVR